MFAARNSRQQTMSVMVKDSLLPAANIYIYIHIYIYIFLYRSHAKLDPVRMKVSSMRDSVILYKVPMKRPLPIQKNSRTTNSRCTLNPKS